MKNNISPINYKSEEFEVTYLEVEKIIKSINKEGISSEIIKITYDANLLSIISYYNINITKEDKFLEIKIINLILLSIITNMLNLGLSKQKTKVYYDSFKQNINYKSYSLLLDFYILQSSLNKEINLYIYEGEVSILSQEEFNIIKKKFGLSDNMISINFNKILYKISKNKGYLNIKNNTFVLEDKVIPIFDKLYDKEYKNMNLRKDKNGELFLLKSELEFNGDDILHGELVRKFKYAEIITKVRKNKVKSFTVNEYIQFN